MFQSGKSGNPSGRPKGAKGKINKDIKALLNDIVLNNIEAVQADLTALDPKDRLMILERFISYLVPKAQRINIESLTEGQLDKLVNEYI